MRNKYIIEINTIFDGWVNVWTIDGEPQTFLTFKQAKKEFDLMFKEAGEEYKAGNVEDLLDRSDYRITPIN